jgi:hypothetical protein
MACLVSSLLAFLEYSRPERDGRKDRRGGGQHHLVRRYSSMYLSGGATCDQRVLCAQPSVPVVAYYLQNT